MATYAVGDVQGCMEPFTRLLGRLKLDAARDRLWLVGDVVNRGPASLAVLRWLKAHERQVDVVLGNHDLHLLGIAEGTRKLKKDDTVADVLDAPDRDELLDWLAARPFLVRRGGELMVHAGLHPSWTADDAQELASELERALRRDRRAFLAMLAEAKASPDFRPAMRGGERLRALCAVMTRVRTCTAEGVLDTEFTGPPRETPAGRYPWFDVPGRKSSDVTVVYGHWASAGLVLRPNLVGVDTGCVWGELLTAVRLDDRSVIQVPA
jgi:bis(5'-nucleosyl)-tetraphosphatase (symmetrical)